MKTRHLLYIVAGVSTLWACVNARENAAPVEEERIPISFYGTIGPETKADANGFQTGDRLGVYVVNYDHEGNPGELKPKGNQVTNVAYTKEATWVPDYEVYYKDKSTHVDFYGYYPYVSSLESVTAIPFEVKEEQDKVGTETAMGAYEASDFLWAKREDVSPSASAVVLPFKHRMSQVAVTLVEGTGFNGTWNSLSKQVLVTGVKRNALIDLRTGTVTPTGQVSARNTVPYFFDNAFRAIVVPQDMAANAPLFTITIDGIPYTYREADAFSYLQGKRHNFEITVNKKADGTYEFSSNSTILPWDDDSRELYLTSKAYVVVELTGASTDTYDELTTKLTEMGISLSDVKNLKLTGRMSIFDFRPILNSQLVALNLSEIQGIDYDKNTYNNENRSWYYLINGNNLRGYIPDVRYYCETDYYFPLEGLTSLKTIIFPENATILDGSLNGTTLSGAVQLPAGLKELNLRFEETNITSINLPSALIRIGSSVFNGCKYLSMNLILPKGLISIGDSAFRSCSGLTGQLILPDTLEEIGGSVFYECSGLTGRLVIPPKITIIPNRAFYGCRALTGLSLHSGITKIDERAFSSCSNMRGELYLPQGIVSLGFGAFSSTKFSGELLIPEGIAAIPESCFTSNEFTEIVLPAELMVIHSYAFSNNTSLKSIKSYAQDPPITQAGSFSNHATVYVDVPNQRAVSDYYSAPGWSSFSNIRAQKDFAVDTDRIEALNEPYTTQVKLEAGELAAWSVALSEGASEWITVSPESGTGPATLTVTLAELPNLYSWQTEGRRATITYVLTGENYTDKTDVAQYNYTPDYNDSYDLPFEDALDGQRVGDNQLFRVWRHTHGAGIPIVFLGDGFSASEISKGNYMQYMKKAIRYFFDPEPYRSYKHFFDVYVLVGMSDKKGIGNGKKPKKPKFGTSFGEDDVLLTDPESIFTNPAIVALGLDLAKTTFVVITNEIGNEGLTVLLENGCTVSYCPLSEFSFPNDFGGTIQFEAGGRGFGRLGDERVSKDEKPGNDQLNGLKLGHLKNWYANLSESGSMGSVPWKHLFEDPFYKNIVDVYEGGMGYTQGVYHSEANSLMYDKKAYYNTISREAIVRRIMELAGEEFSFESFKANDVTQPHNEIRENGGL